MKYCQGSAASKLKMDPELVLELVYVRELFHSLGLGFSFLTGQRSQLGCLILHVRGLKEVKE